MWVVRLLVLGSLAAAVSLCGAAEDESIAAHQAIVGITIPDEFRIALYADFSQVANPVAFCFDQQGRLYVCETFRQQRGVEDNRDHMDWLDDDLAAQTVEDRLAYFKKHLQDKIAGYTERDDRIRVIEDQDQDGRADRSWVFADGFNDVLSGTGAGVLAIQQDILYACIPDLWRLRDEDGDGKADQRQRLHSGFGVRVAFRGHDLHGLTMGPDGRVYFSIGDRGYNVTTEDQQLADPESGAVFRCHPDGSELEVFATGLRNPQELAFDDYGNLFTADNNSDSGDQARWVHVVEGSDSGWRMAFQYLPDRGPWNREKLWHPQHEGQAAFIVPPVANIADGPSGLAYYPGTGLTKDYRGTFFLCDFRGDAAVSGVRTFKMKPRGATFELIDPQKFLWNCLVTDIDFGPDGAIYISDWIEGWEGVDGGRIFRIYDPGQIYERSVKNVRSLLASDMSQRRVGSLRRLLGHPDRRVRMKAQFELAGRGAITQLATVAREEVVTVARLHAIWGLGQAARSGKGRFRIAAILSELLKDADPEVRAVSASVLGELPSNQAVDSLIVALADRSPRTVYLAAISLGRRGARKAVDPVLSMLAANNDRDPVLRHAGVMALAGIGHVPRLAAATSHPDRAVRMAALLALRRLESGAVANFLQDQDPLIVLEAARAIHDVPIGEATSQLALLISRGGDSDPLLRRVLCANYRLGTPQHALQIAEFAARTDVPQAMRLEALEMLATWARPSSRDRVLGMWRPLAPRPAAPAATALRSVLDHVVDSDEAVAVAAARIAAQLGIIEAGPILHRMIGDSRYSSSDRARLLESLHALTPDETDSAVQVALQDGSPEVRLVARRLLAASNPQQAVQELAAATRSGALVERQAALADLAEMQRPAAVSVIRQAMEQLLVGKVPSQIQLDVIEAARKSTDPQVRAKLQEYESRLAANDPLAPHRGALTGGDADRGRTLFHQNIALSCLRCHQVGDQGGRVGPDLSDVGKRKPREYLLESIVDPNRTISEGFGTVVLATEDGLTRQGVVSKETDGLIYLIDADGRSLAVAKDEIIARRQGQSSMPDDLIKQLTPFDLRDLVEYLASLQTPPKRVD